MNSTGINEELKRGIALMASKKEEGFNIVYANTYDYVYKRAKYIMKTEDDAMDLVQETYVQAYKGIDSMRDANNVYAWLGAIVYNQGMQIFRKRKELLLDEEAEGIFDDIVAVDVDGSPEESMEIKETAKIVSDMLDELPELQRAAVVAFYYDNMKIDDIAKQFGCSSNTIKSRLNYAKKFLKEKVEDHEKKNGYKLHSVAPFIIVLALKGLFAKAAYAADGAAMSSTFGSIRKKIGMNNIGAEMATNVEVSNMSANTATGGVTNAAANSATVASTAAKVGMGLGAKIGLVAAAVGLAASIGVGIAIFGGSDEASKENGTKNEYDDASTDDIVNNETEDATESGDKNFEVNSVIQENGYYYPEFDADGSEILVNETGAIKVDNKVFGYIYAGYYLYSDNGSQGVKHLDGRTIIEAGTYEEINWIEYYTGLETKKENMYLLLLVKNEKGYGVIDAEGKIIVELEHDSVEYAKYYRDGSMDYVITANKTNEMGEIYSAAYLSDGTKFFELVGEKINASNFANENLLYYKKDDNGKKEVMCSVKTGEVLFDLKNEGIEDINVYDYKGEITYADTSKKYLLFNEDYTAYEYIDERKHFEYDRLKVGDIFVNSTFGACELTFYEGGEIVKIIKGVEGAWIGNDKLYYIVGDRDDADGKAPGIYDENGIILDGDKYEWRYHEGVMSRYIVVKEKGQSTFQLYDLEKKEVVVTGITNVEPEQGFEYFTWSLEDGRSVTLWRREKIVIHAGDLKMISANEEYVVLSKNEGKIKVIEDLEGNELFEFEAESHNVDYIHNIVIHVNGSSRAFYNFKGELIYEIKN